MEHPDGRYQQVFIDDRQDPNCQVTGQDWDPPVMPKYDTLSSIGQGRCLSYRLSDEPGASIALRDQRETVDALFGLFPLRKPTRQVVRLADDTVLVEAVYFEYDSRLFDNSLGEVAHWPEFLAQALPASPQE